jgi:hypothetical protein
LIFQTILNCVSLLFFWDTLDGQLWPSIIHSFQLFFGQCFLHMIHMHVAIMSSKFYKKWRMKSWSKSSNICNYEGYPK